MKTESRAEVRNESMVAAYADMVADNTLTAEKAAEKLGMTVDEFKEAIKALTATT